MRDLVIFAALAAALSTAACGYTPEQRAASGAAIGAGSGAAIAAAAGGRPGTVIGSSLLGATAGAIIGANTAPAVAPVYVAGRPPCRVWDEDMFGRRYCRERYVY